MEAILKYRATDGSEWTTQQECVTRDQLDAQVRALETEIGPGVDRGRRKIDPVLVARVKADVVALCREKWPNEAVFQHDPAEIHPMSYAGRFLDDAGGPIRRIWWRFACTNGEWEYEQPYFALHPEKFKATDSGDPR